MTHIAIQEALDGKAVDWMEKVTDERYRAGSRPCNRANYHLHRSPSHRAPLLAIILVSYGMIVLDISIVITALLEID